MATQAVDDNSRLEQHTFDHNMTTLMTLVKKGDHHRASIILNEIIEHLDPFSPNIREQSQAINQLNTMLHESAMAGHDSTDVAANETGSAATRRSNTSVSCDMCLEHNKTRHCPQLFVHRWKHAPASCLPVCTVICEKQWY